MAVDIRIEQFGIDLFRHLWKRCGFESTILERPKEYGDKTKHDCTHIMIHAVYCRYRFFRRYHSEYFRQSYDQYSRDGIDFYYFLCKHITIFQIKNTFDQLFNICAIVAEMCFQCMSRNNNIYRYIGPLCWAMYFETKFKEEFYDTGGWEKLEKYAEAYNSKLLQQEYLKTIRGFEDFCKLYELANLDYHLEEIVQRVWNLYSNNSKTSCCMNCFPILCVFVTRYKTNVLNLPYDINDRKIVLLLIEGFIQVFMRMLPSEDIEAIKEELNERAFRNISNSSLTPNVETSTLPLCSVVPQLKDITTSQFCKRLFADVSSVKLENDLNCTFCMFCGARTDSKFEMKCNKNTDSVRIKNMKMVIEKAVFEVMSTESLKQEPCIDPSDELEERMALRLFPFIGMKSGFIKMLAYINEKLGTPQYTDEQGVLSSTTTLGIKEESNKKISKNKRKKFVK